MRCRIGITLGDPAGVGPEIVQAALASARLPENADYSIIGPSIRCQLGQPTNESAKVALLALEEGVTRARRGEIDAVVTGPIHKTRMHEIGFAFPGQTEFFASRCGVTNFAMLLTGGNLTVALVTTHMPLGEAITSLNKNEIVRVGLLLEDFLHRRGIQKPRIAVAGLNPHAGESGTFGREETDIIVPAVAELNARSAIFAGPFSPDTLFFHAASGDWDGVLCMYHDQGLIPLKLHAFYQGVNVTLGLPFPRTSPDHGTAFSIAGKRLARADSMIAAIQLAVELAQRNQASTE